MKADRAPAILACLIYVLVVGACAWAAFSAGAWVLGTIAVVGVVACLCGIFRAACAWSDPKPWDEGDGE